MSTTQTCKKPHYVKTYFFFFQQHIDLKGQPICASCHLFLLKLLVLTLPWKLFSCCENLSATSCDHHKCNLGEEEVWNTKIHYALAYKEYRRCLDSFTKRNYLLWRTERFKTCGSHPC